MAFYGTDGDDVVTNNALTEFYLGAGNDAFGDPTAASLVFGGTGSDALTGSPLSDQFYGDPGNDLLIGANGGPTSGTGLTAASPRSTLSPALPVMPCPISLPMSATSTVLLAL